MLVPTTATQVAVRPSDIFPQFETLLVVSQLWAEQISVQSYPNYV